MPRVEVLYPYLLRSRSDLARRVDRILDVIHVTRRFYSSKGQDRWIIEQVLPGQKHGFFVEVGAGDGRTHSNTYALERDLGWTGILVEANPAMAEMIPKFRKCYNFNSCVNSSSQFVEFFHFGHLGGIVAQDTDNSPNTRSWLLRRYSSKVQRIETRLLAEILDNSSAPSIIDYLSLDIEGAELRVLSTFPFDRYSFRAITVERPIPAIHQILTANGYLLVRLHRYDGFYLSNELATKLAMTEAPYEETLKKSF